MNKTPDHTPLPVVAIDGGGTRCRLALRDASGDTVVELGSANVTSDFDAAIAVIRDGAAQLCVRTGLSPEALFALPTYAGLAGVEGASIANRVTRALPFTHIRVEHDRASALKGALGDRDGALAHCGTGSFFITQVDKTARFAGGWGPVLGDPASAQWVGRRALSLTLDAVDGLLPHSALSRAILTTYKDAEGIVTFAAKATPAAFGALAPEVTRHADEGDAIARQVLGEAADYIADILPKLGWAVGMDLCLTGGIAPQFAAYLPDEMQRRIIAPSGEPLSGALMLAEAYREEIAHECC